MASIVLECVNFNLLFSTGYAVSANATMKLNGCMTMCPHCKTEQSMPDGTFREKIRGLIEYIEKQDSPVQAADEILAALEEAKEKSNTSILQEKRFYSALEPWLPKTPEKLLIYVTLVHMVLSLYKAEAPISLDISNETINNYNQTIIHQLYNAPEQP